MLMQHTAASGMGGGVSSAIARALGAGKRTVADALAFHAFVLALGLAAPFSTVLPPSSLCDGWTRDDAVCGASLCRSGVHCSVIAHVRVSPVLIFGLGQWVDAVLRISLRRGPGVCRPSRSVTY
jgi:hypothetical protein